MRYAVRRVSPLSALLYGLILGLAGWLLPGLALGWLASLAVAQLRQWLAALNFVIPVPLTEGVLVDLVSLLQLGDTQAQLAALAARQTAVVLAITLATAAAGMLLTGLTAFLAALLYNLLARVFGGVEVTLEALDVPAVAVTGGAPASAARPAKAIAPAAVAAAAVPPPAANPARPTPYGWLVPVTPGERWPLGDDVTRIGSAPGNDIVLPGLSPEHAEIRRESGRYLIYDLGSRRTWVNDAQVAAVHMLKDGFRLQLGQSEFLVQIVAVQGG